MEWTNPGAEIVVAVVLCYVSELSDRIITCIDIGSYFCTSFIYHEIFIVFFARI